MKKKIHYAWFITACCFLIQSSTTGIFSNCISLYNPSIIREFGFANGAFSTSLTIRSLCTSIGLALSARIYNRNTYKKIFTVCATASALVFCSQIFFDRLWMWFLENALLGFFLGFIMTVPLNIIINNWFEERAGLALGIAMASSGVIGIIVNPLSSYLISTSGWRYGIVMLGVLSFLLVVPCVLTVLKWDPEEIGMEPYREAVREEKTEAVFSRKTDSPKVVAAAIILVILVYGLTQYFFALSMYVDSLGYSVIFAGYMSSAVMMGNLFGKIAMGVLLDRYGVFRVSKTGFFLNGLGFVIFLLFPTKICILIASVFFGLSMSLAALVPGLLSRECFEPEASRSIMSRMTSIATFVNALLYLGISYSYDLLGSFSFSFALAVLMALSAIVLCAFIEKTVKDL